MPVPGSNSDDLAPRGHVARPISRATYRKDGSVREDGECASPACGDTHGVRPVRGVALAVAIPAGCNDCPVRMQTHRV